MKRYFALYFYGLLAVLAAQVSAYAEPITPFIGHYEGSAEFEEKGKVVSRDMSVSIVETDDGFVVNWSSTSYKSDGRTKEKNYEIEFIDTLRDGIYSSAMGKNVFGNPVALDPLKGDPYVWARVSGNVLTIFSLLIDEQGGYEMQEYNRTLVEGGLELEYKRVRNGLPLKNINSFLKKTK